METAEPNRKKCANIMLLSDLICYNRPAVALQSTSACRAENGIGMTREKDHKPEKEKESEPDVRDLPPKKDVKGGSSKEKGTNSNRTGEVDFMRNYD